MWRQMCIQDVSSVCSIAMDIWSDYGETPAIYENKFRVSPKGCYVYVVNDSIKGYVISHPWNILSPPPLNTLFTEVEVNCEERRNRRGRGSRNDRRRFIFEVNCQFIHDIVVLPECRGRGVGDEIIQKILADNPIVSLVASNKTVKTKDFWTRYGFEVVEALDCNYGIYMIRKS
jgi:ribosomal protein S18 acetylase RimI-like enzyme